MTTSPRELSIRQRLKDDFEHYATKCLRIRSKAGTIEPLALNRAQQHLHNELERQRAKTGRVRALVLKGRQQGVSTYIGGRFYHAVTHRKGQRIFILTHEQEATDNLFDMVTRYHDHCPDLVKPHTGAANAKELYFDGLDSGYKVGTAGTKAVGRSQTIQRFHGSEVAFWPHAETHAAGVLQAIPDMDDTEVILESTANGVGNFFHQRWQEAESGQSKYIAVFIPWYWQDEYRSDPGDIALTEEEEQYRDAYGLDMEQMAWRRSKIAELRDPLLFKQEYPATAAEAFQMTGHDSYIKPDLIVQARKAEVEPVGDLVLGVDPARFGDDQFAICWRRGRKVEKVERKAKLDLVAGANWVKQVYDADEPVAVFIDVGGLGAGVVDILHGWDDVDREKIIPVNFGSAPQEPDIIMPDGKKQPGAKNRRAEMWKRSKEWLEDISGADIPDDDALQADACGPSYTYDMNQRLVLESKEKMRARGVRSPDGWDSVVLTFAEPAPRKKKKVREAINTSGHWMG